MKEQILRHLAGMENGYSACGIIDRRGRVYPLGTDTKVLSTIFEIIARQAVADYARQAHLLLIDSDKQNYYPDFTLAASRNDAQKIAIDVKTTYKNNADDDFRFTLGSYTSFLRNETKNIMFPFRQYREHWIIGFVYHRVAVDADASGRQYTVADLAGIPAPFTDVEVFVQEKWRIAGDRPGSGNTANIGSIRGKLNDFQQGNGVFGSESEFLAYWRGYGATAAERKYRNVGEFRAIEELESEA